MAARRVGHGMESGVGRGDEGSSTIGNGRFSTRELRKATSQNQDAAFASEKEAGRTSRSMTRKLTCANFQIVSGLKILAKSRTGIEIPSKPQSVSAVIAGARAQFSAIRVTGTRRWRQTIHAKPSGSMKSARRISPG